jgi:hypothetical protein
MPPRTNAFQRLAYLIHEQIPNAVRVSESAMLVDRLTGQEREVDILVELDKPYSISIGIECIAKTRKADITWVEQMHAKHQHLTDKVILLSQKGFYSTAKAMAEKFGMLPLTIEKPMEADWSREIHQIAEVSLTPVLWDIERIKLYGKTEQDIQYADPSTILYLDNEKIPQLPLYIISDAVQGDSNISEHDERFSGEERHYACRMGGIRPCYILKEDGEKFEVRDIEFFYRQFSGDKEVVQLNHGVLKDSHIAFGQVKIDGVDSILLFLQNDANSPTITLSVSGHPSIIRPLNDPSAKPDELKGAHP